MNQLLPWALKAVGAAAMAGGTALGAAGASSIASAKVRIDEATQKYETAYNESKTHEALVNDALKNLGDWQEHSIKIVATRMSEFLRRHEKQVSENAKLLAAGFKSHDSHVSIGEIQHQDPLDWAQTLTASALTGFSVKAGLTSFMLKAGSASTGTKIASLSGIAKTKAMQAAFGGGSKASGGGGIASGKNALAMVTIGPAVLLTGLVVATQGQQAKTQATEVEATANIAVEELNAKRVAFNAVEARSRELWTLLNNLTERGVMALNALESVPFNPAQHAHLFQQALQLAVAVRDVTAIPILGDDGDVNKATEGLEIQYRDLLRSQTNDSISTQ